MVSKGANMNKTFNQLTDELSRELDALFARFPDLHPNYRRRRKIAPFLLAGDPVYMNQEGVIVSAHSKSPVLIGRVLASPDEDGLVLVEMPGTFVTR